jgi:hypothetical protein
MPASESDETFRLSPKEEAELLLSIDEADCEATVSLEEVLEMLPGRALTAEIGLRLNRRAERRGARKSSGP